MRGWKLLFEGSVYVSKHSIGSCKSDFETCIEISKKRMPFTIKQMYCSRTKLCYHLYRGVVWLNAMCSICVMHVSGKYTSYFKSEMLVCAM